MKPKILLLGSQHGDEYSGEQLNDYIQANHTDLLDYVSFMIANPRARQQRVRFVQTDMNRSYTGSDVSYEEAQAVSILQQIKDEDFDLVLDMHTTTCDQPPCLIVASITADNKQFLQATSMEKIVVMNNPIVKNALNGVCTQAVSVEIQERSDDEVYEGICADIKRYINNEQATVEKEVYEITGLIDKSEVSSQDIARLRNFTMSEYGYYPVLVGENSYEKFTDFRGFKAYKRYAFKV